MKIDKCYFYIAFIIFIITAIVITYMYINNTFETFGSPTVKIVVARYNETLEWLNEEPFNTYPVIVFNKGPNDNFNHSKMIEQIVTLDNVGRESHSYLYYIINNYDNLSDITIFLPGSTSSTVKKEKAVNVINNLHNKHNVFACTKQDNAYEKEYNFVIDDYLSTNNDNKSINLDPSIQISDIRPFGKWYQTFFNNTLIECLPYQSIFAVSKKTVLNRPKSFYELLLNELNKHHNPEAGHYMERSWSSIFSSDDKLFV